MSAIPPTWTAAALGIRQSLSEIMDRNKPTVVLVHSPRAATTEVKREGRVLPKGSDGRDPRNYLKSGGARALDKDREKQQAQMAREKVKELKTASTALASELLRTRQESERELTVLRDEMMELTTRFRSEQERIAALKDRLAEEGRARGEVEEAHQERVRELHKRLQAEHLLRVNAEMELAKSQDTSSTAAAQIRGVEGELAGALGEVSALQDAKLEAELALNRERRQHAEAQGHLESAKLALERERGAREALQRKNAELEGAIKGLTERNSVLFDDLKTCEAALHAAKEAKSHVEGTVGHHKEEIRVLHEQLDSQKKARAAAVEESRRLQQRALELEAGTAVYIAKEAHYDDLKDDYDEVSQQLHRVQGELERAKGDVESLMGRLDAAMAKSSSLEASLAQREGEVAALREELDRAAAEHKAAAAALQREADAQEEAAAEAAAAVKLLMGAVREKEGALREAEAAAAEAQGGAEALRRGRDELARVVQEKEAYAELLRAELRTRQEEVAALQRRHKQMQSAVDASELEVSRRDLKLKELSDALHMLSNKLADEQEAAAGDKRRMEGVIRSLEARTTQSQSELAGTKEELVALRQHKINTHAELAAAQDECAHLRSQLTEEQGRSHKLRGELASVSSSHMKEVESRGQVVADVMGRLQAEEAAKEAAEHEIRALKRRIEEAETALAEAQSSQSRTQEAYDNAQAALESMKRKLQVYKKENKSLMSSYDDWLKTMVRTRPGVAPGQ